MQSKNSTAYFLLYSKIKQKAMSYPRHCFLHYSMPINPPKSKIYSHTKDHSLVNLIFIITPKKIYLRSK